MVKASPFAGYDAGRNYCEILGLADTHSPPNSVNPLAKRLSNYKIRTLNQRNSAAERELHNLGITFTVYSDAGAIDRILPFDPIPRQIPQADWK